MKERAESSHPESKHSLAVFLNLEPYNLEVLDTSLEQSYKEKLEWQEQRGSRGRAETPLVNIHIASYFIP